MRKRMRTYNTCIHVVGARKNRRIPNNNTWRVLLKNKKKKNLNSIFFQIYFLQICFKKKKNQDTFETI